MIRANDNYSSNDPLTQIFNSQLKLQNAPFVENIQVSKIQQKIMP